MSGRRDPARNSRFPFFEQRWRDAHTRSITYLHDALQERLPAIGVPLRPSDADAVVDLQPLIDQCHERGRYHLLHYRLEPDPPLSPDDALWVDQRLREQGLR